jgi:hypothetical protein
VRPGAIDTNPQLSPTVSHRTEARVAQLRGQLDSIDGPGANYNNTQHKYLSYGAAFDLYVTLLRVQPHHTEFDSLFRRL